MSILPQEDLYRRAAGLIQSASYAVALTGAGMSTPSGIPDFRSSNTGLWTQNDPMRVASLSAFRYHPEVFFNWLRPLGKQIWRAEPNPAHAALAQLEQAGFLKAVVTQNIDNLHQRAGSRNVIEVHGSLGTLTCPRCRKTYLGSDFYQAFVEEGAMPSCPDDQALLKPDIVLFEEMLPEKAWRQAEEACSRADLLLVAGSALEVSPVNQLPVYALQNQAQVILVNLSSTYLDGSADVILTENVATALPRIAELVLENSD